MPRPFDFVAEAGLPAVAQSAKSKKAQKIEKALVENQDLFFLVAEAGLEPASA
jgi:hypothetical protein